MTRYVPAPRPGAAIQKRNVPDRLAREVLSEADGCAYCGDRLAALQVEHRRPLSRGGDNTRSNLTAACISCNMDKKSMLLHEWRGYRQANGMPWPPLATHAADWAHYMDDCSECKDVYWTLVDPLPDDDKPSFSCVPVIVGADGGRGFRGLYQCPLGHRWRCWWAWDQGYYSDCPCAWCQAHRDDNNEATYPATPPYAEVPAALAHLVRPA